jgi:hypothetical protein
MRSRERELLRALIRHQLIDEFVLSIQSPRVAAPGLKKRPVQTGN